MKVIFAPYFRSNPYQNDLANALKKSKDISFTFVESGLLSFLRLRKKNEIIHLHWFEKYTLGSNFFATAVKIFLFLYKIKVLKKSVKLIWTVHNLSNHEKKHLYLERVFLKRYIEMIDAFSVHNQYTANILVNEYKIDIKKIYLIPHANYIGVYEKSFDHNCFDKIVQLGFDKNKFTYMIMGNIRPYKGVLDVINAFKDLDDSKIQLLICGKVYSDKDKEIIFEVIKNEENIFFIPEFIKDEYLSTYLDCADVLVYSYKDILTSGALMLGMSFSKVCIASNVGSMSELIDENFLFNDQDDLKNVLNKVSILTKEEIKFLGEKNFEKVKDNTWMKTAELTFNMYTDILN